MVHEMVQKFYLEKMRGVQKTVNPHCNNFKKMESLPTSVKEALGTVHCDIIKRSFSCGCPFPQLLEGCKVLDLGSGAGKDCFAFSRLVGKTGHVIGVDMLLEMVEFANKYIDYHGEKYGYKNVEFRLGFLENLEDSASLQPSSFDIVASNCVIALCPDKRKVYQSAFNILRPGGEMFFSDIYSNSPVKPEVKDDPEAYNEGYGGAVQWDEFTRMLREIGFLGPFVVSSKPYDPFTPNLVQLIADGSYFSATVRLIKPMTKDGLDVPKTAEYLGTIPECQNEFRLDQHHTFLAQEKTTAEVGDSAVAALFHSRYASHFCFQ